MADDNIGNDDNTDDKLNNVQQIIQHAINKEPSKLKDIVGREIASHVMGNIQAKKTEIGSDLFGM